MVSFFCDVLQAEVKSPWYPSFHMEKFGWFVYFPFEAASLQVGICIVDGSEWKRMIAVFACRGEEFILCDSFDSDYNGSGLALILPLFFFLIWQFCFRQSLL